MRGPWPYVLHLAFNNCPGPGELSIKQSPLGLQNSKVIKTKMTLESFYQTWNGKYCDFDHAYGPQCTDVVKEYLKDVLNLPPIPGNAIDYTKHPLFIPKNGHPEPGDILVFDYPPVGHVSICVWWSELQVGCFGQNDPVGSPCGFKVYSYKDILGWIRPKSQKFTLDYTVFNGTPSLMEQARQLLVQYSGGKLDCTFDYKTVPTQPGVFTTDKQVHFLKTHSTNPFVFYFYDAGLSGSQMATAEVPTTGKVMTCATPLTQDPLLILYEFVNAVYAHLHRPGDDIYIPTEEFVKEKINGILPFLKEVLS